jgi:16S rRNA (cytidine1402-2'-O)-methyltransferase
MITFVPTPIGNLGDITLRSIEALKNSDLILSEDPRVTAQLLKKLEIPTKKMISFGAEGENYKLEIILSEYKDKQIVIVSDAGMPGISDPGYAIVQLAQQNSIQYTFLPGASAGVTAAAASGLVSKEYLFIGFLPHKKGRMTEWKRIADSRVPVVLYESVHRIIKAISEIKEYLSVDREIFIAREMTKVFETYWRGKVSNLQEYQLVEKGEFVIVIGVK